MFANIIYKYFIYTYIRIYVYIWYAEITDLRIKTFHIEGLQQPADKPQAMAIKISVAEKSISCLLKLKLQTYKYLGNVQ